MISWSHLETFLSASRKWLPGPIIFIVVILFAVRHLLLRWIARASEHSVPDSRLARAGRRLRKIVERAGRVACAARIAQQQVSYDERQYCDRPNSQLVDAIFTNLRTRDGALSIEIDLNVAGASDLERVERVTSEIASSVMASVDGDLPGSRRRSTSNL